eukprot:TRINITY_DN2766_c0_g1_i3.p1 TRINITY_DN2766_c0_g1~~TRINITY_DN2766_c0_g1_i3.p1  ORF type:complete len:336 (+),score=65.99 TRINITY_DN2766_c0_g1_i3:43-1050(+)
MTTTEEEGPLTKVEGQGIPLSELKNWQDNSNSFPDFDDSLDDDPLQTEFRFPFNEEINRKISLWDGDITKLSVDAITCSTNESLTDKQNLSSAIFEAAGPDLAVECKKIGGCKTGEAVSSLAYDLPCKKVIHTVGPRFSVKYRLAAENALNSCYRTCLQTLHEDKLRTIAFLPIHSELRSYPAEEGCHIALRTIRRYMDAHGEDIDMVVIAFNGPVEEELYSNAARLYFPRNCAQARIAEKHLPQDTGNSEGRTVVEERAVRIGMPEQLRTNESSISVVSKVDIKRARAFTSMQPEKVLANEEEKQKERAVELEDDQLEAAIRSQRIEYQCCLQS